MKVFINCEPTIPADNFGKYDLFLTSALVEGAEPQFFQDILWHMPAHNWVETKKRDEHKPIKDREIDILYRSSKCEKRRDRIADEISKQAKENGLRFVSSGNCQASHSEPIYSSTKDWETCDLCENSKMILALERFKNNSIPYLSEKPALAFSTGAIPVYHGTGTSLLEDVQGVDPTSYLNISSFSNVEAAKHVVDLAKNTRKLQEMQQTPTFLSPTSRQDNINKVRELTCKEDYIKNNNITVDLGYRLINPSALPVLEELLCIDDKNVNYTYNKPSSDIIIEGFHPVRANKRRPKWL